MKYEGNMSLLTDKKLNKVGVIGSRCSNIESLYTAFNVGQWIADKYDVLVTGMANGIDTMAMLGALKEDPDGYETNQSHIAVLPSLGKLVPENNSLVINDILNNNGLVLALHDKYDINKSDYLRRNDLLLNIVELLVVVGRYEVPSGTHYTVTQAEQRNIPIVFVDGYKEYFPEITEALKEYDAK